jgi:hypothetical protein
MNGFGKLVVKMGLISLLSVMPLAAQIENGVDVYHLISVLRGKQQDAGWLLQNYAIRFRYIFAADRE